MCWRHHRPPRLVPTCSSLEGRGARAPSRCQAPRRRCLRRRRAPVASIGSAGDAGARHPRPHRRSGRPGRHRAARRRAPATGPAARPRSGTTARSTWPTGCAARSTEGRGYANVVARSADGVTFETVATVTSEQFGAASLERPALVAARRRLAALRLVLHPRLQALVGRGDRGRRPRPGSPRARAPSSCPATRGTAWKDVVVRRDRARLADVGLPPPARRRRRRGRPDDQRLPGQRRRPGLEREGHRARARRPAPGTPAARGSPASCAAAPNGSRSTTAGPARPRTGTSAPGTRWARRRTRSGPPAGRRRPAAPCATSASSRPLTGTRLYWEASRSDGANDLRTAYVPRPLSPSQS